MRSARFMRSIGRLAPALAVIALAPAPSRAVVNAGTLFSPRAGYLSIALVDEIALIAGPRGLLIIDVSSPAEPVEIGAIETPWPLRTITRAGHLALVSSFDPPRMHIYDVSVSTAPRAVGPLDSSGKPIEAAVDGSTAYVADAESGLLVFDLSNPSAPIQLGALAIAGGARAVTLVSSVAYIALASGDHLIVDVSNPSTPVAIDRVAGLGPIIATANGIAYAQLPDGLQLIDVSNPRAPVAISAVKDTAQGFPRDVAVSDGFAFVANDSAGLLVIDVSNPSEPIARGALAVTVQANGIEVEGQFAYVVDQLSLRVIDISRPETPTALGSAGTSHVTAGLSVVGGIAYVANDASGLRVFDVSDPTALHEIGAVDTPGHAANVAVAGTLAYVADFSAGMRVIDVADPRAPVEIGAIETAGEAWDVAVRRGVAYVADGRFGFRTFDVSNPRAPVQIAAIDTPGEALGVTLAGELAYVADGRSGLRIFDVSNPAAPFEIGSIDTPQSRCIDTGCSSFPWRQSLGAHKVAVSGRFAYVASDSSIDVIDVSDPAAPVGVGRTPHFYEDNWVDIGVVGATAFVAGSRRNAGVGAYDISNPAAPIERGTLVTPCCNPFLFVDRPAAHAVAVRGGVVYAASGSELFAIEFGPEYLTGIDVDVKPSDTRNAVQAASMGVVPVAILGSESFDVANVDPTTIRFGPEAALPSPRTPGRRADVNGDGYADLLLQFRTQQTGISLGDSEACLSGSTLDGVALHGCDAIHTLPRVRNALRPRR